MGAKTGIDGSEAWALSKRNLRQLRLSIEGPRGNGGIKAVLAAGDVKIEYFYEQIYERFYDHKRQLDELIAIAGIDSFARVALNDGDYSASTNLTATSSAIQACLTWINTAASNRSISTDTGENYLLTKSISTERYSAAQTVGLRTLLDAVLATIDD